jgi:hypothetical protein
VLETLELSTISTQGYAFQVEMSYRAALAGFHLVEIPIVFRERSSGKSKMSGAIVVEGIRWVTRTGLTRLVPSRRKAIQNLP